MRLSKVEGQGEGGTRRRAALAAAAACILSLVSSGARAATDDLAAGMRWRLVGPQRAGWGTCVAGIPERPDTFYFGAAGGGGWKTTAAGHTWSPGLDRGPASIGAAAIEPPYPNV